MIAKRRLVAELLYRSGLFRLVTRAGRLVVFNYHRIRRDAADATPFDDDVYGPTAAELDAQLGWLGRHCRVLSEDELVAGATSGRWPTGRLAAITFDDAYRDQYTLAWPLLGKHNLPAIFFVPTQLVGERRLGWWDLIAWVLKRTRRDTLELDGIRYRLPAERARACAVLQTRMKLGPASATARLVDELAETCDVPLPDRAAQDAELMDWDALRHIAADGKSAIGSHAHSHRVLATLDPVDQEIELSLSRALLERELGRPVRSLAYPVGGPAHFSDATQAIAQRCGYRIAFSYHGVNRDGRLDPFNIRRSSMGGDDRELSMMAAATVLPELYH